ncbi:MAG: class I SAM-dependent methyltransferase [Candidatus Thorarchaeota archaeon]
MTDTFGRIMCDAVEGKDSSYIIERDDGFVRHTSGDPYTYPFEKWNESEKEAMKDIKGPVLDVGCGVGRVGDYVKRKGLKYYGVDLSPLAVKMCQKRGHENVFVMSADDIRLDRSDFRTVVLYGNNFGIMGKPEDVVRMLSGFHDITTDDAVVLAGSIDPVKTDNKMHLAYHNKNLAEGNPPGLVRLRNKYKGEVDDWWYLLLAGRELMSELAEKGGWYLDRIVGGLTKRHRMETYNVGVLKKRKL